MTSGSAFPATALPQATVADSHASEPGIHIKNVDGSTVIVYRGQEFSVGPTKGDLSGKTKRIQGQDYAAVFEGNRVVWENTPGAARRVK